METQAQPNELAHGYKLPPLTLLMLIVEIVILLSVCWLSMQRFRDWDVTYKISGDEFSYLINSGAIANEIYQRSGSLPLWNPFIKSGEPMYENPFSFVLNPLMTLPIMAWGMYNGSKAALIIHILGLGLGGWTLGRVLRLRSAGRVFLGLALAGNGSLAGSISGGFFQMTLTQTYIPWILAGMIGTLYLKRRWPIALLAIATALQMFGGTFWYVLPTAITCGLLALFSLKLTPNTRGVMLDGVVFRRLLLAGVFVVLLGMVRLLPQIAHRDYVIHPEADLGRTDAIERILEFYFSPELPPPPYGALFIFYHYAMPLWFLGLVAGLRLVLYKPFYSIFTARWRILLPLIISFVFYTLWAQEKTPFNQWLYSTFTFFKEWRFLARMMAAATPMLIIVTAIWFDDLAHIAKPMVAAARTWVLGAVGGTRLPQLNRLPTLSRILLIAMLVLGLTAALDLQRNWQRVGGLDRVDSIRLAGVTWVRELQPHTVNPVATSGFFNYFSHWETLSRATFGNPDYRPRGDFSTLGYWSMMPFNPEWAIGVEGPYVDYLTQNDYQRIDGSPAIAGMMSVWRKPNAIPYAFLVSKERLNNTALLLNYEDTVPVSYYHRIDSVLVPLGTYAPGSVLVIQETAYPGWEVRINGQPAPFDSVMELAGVVLPEPAADGTEIVVEFAYHPRELYLGGYTTLITALVMMLYLLRADRLLRRFLPDDFESRTSQRVTNAAQRMMRVLTDEKLLESKQDED
jgi:hypothetical protein